MTTKPQCQSGVANSPAWLRRCQRSASGASRFCSAHAAKDPARKAAAERMEASRAEAVRIVASGRCPHCGSGLRRNLSIAGWWQCEQYGADGFRKDSTKPSCLGQWFTE